MSVKLASVGLVNGARIWIADLASDLAVETRYEDCDLCLIKQSDGTNAYDTYIYKASIPNWVKYIDDGAVSSTGWNLTGNAGTAPIDGTGGVNFFGTTDNNGVVFKTNNFYAGFLGTADGSVFFGTNAGYNGSGARNSTVAVNNVAIGTGVFPTNVSLTNNKNIVAIGNLALGNTGAFTFLGGTVAIGAQALQNLSVGGIGAGLSGATAVGYQAGMTAGGSTSTFIGSQADGNVGVTQAVVIGCLAKVTGAGGTSNGQYHVVIGADAFIHARGTDSLVNPQGSVAIGYNATVATSNTAHLGSIAIGNKVAVTAVDAIAIGNIITNSVAHSAVIGSPTYNVANGGLTFYGALRPNALPGTAGQVLTSSGNAAPPTWTTPSTGWSLTGNAGTTPGTNFVGTTDAQDLVFKVNSQKGGFISKPGDSVTTFGFVAGDAIVSTTSGLTAIGSNAAQNTTGDFNTAVGYNSLRQNTTGVNCTAVGVQAIENNSFGTDNTALGYQAGRQGNPASSFNTSVGSQAGVVIQNDNNTAIGYHALVLNSQGARNTAVGSQTGINVDQGSDNILIGYLADVAVGLAGTFMSNTVVIGTSINATADNTVTIGNTFMTELRFWGALRPNGGTLGFTGTGTYTNFTIVGGVIVAAS